MTRSVRFVAIEELPRQDDLLPAIEQISGVVRFQIAHSPGEATTRTVAHLLERSAVMVRAIGRDHGEVPIRAISFEQDEYRATAECTMTVFFGEPL